MKLAEALQERADLNRKIAQLNTRVNNNAMAQEGETPLEDPQALLRELDGAIARLEALMAAINRTNSQTMIDGVTLTQMIARKDCLNIRLDAYRNLAYHASQTTQRAKGTEIKVLPTVNVAGLQKQVDTMAKELRRLDNRLQETNWQVDLIED